MKIISTIKSNKIFKVGLALSFFLLILMIAFLISGHFIVEDALREKSATIDLSDPATQKRYNRLMSDFNNLKEERESLKLIRIPKDDVVSLVQYFEEISLKSEVKQTINVVKSNENKNEIEYNIPTIRYKINIAGGDQSISGYLASLRTAPFFLMLESFEIIAPNEDSLGGEYLATIFVAVATEK